MDQQVDVPTLEEGQLDVSINDAVASEPTPEQAPAAEPDLHKYTANGKEISESLDMIKKRASMGYNYAQQMEGFNKQKADYDSQIQRSNDIEAKYKHLDDYARQNPEWNTFVQEQWENRGQAATTSGEQSPEVQALRQELSQAVNSINEIKATEIDRVRQAEDSQLTSEIEGVRKNYSNIDFGATDELGKSLEYKVTEFGVNKGIKSFEDAFKLFYHDNLMQMAQTNAKETFGKELQQRNKDGFTGKTSTPTKGLTQAQDIKNKSYDDLLQEALQEFG